MLCTYYWIRTFKKTYFKVRTMLSAKWPGGSNCLPSLLCCYYCLAGQSVRRWQARPSLLFSVSDERGESGQGQDCTEQPGLAGKQPGQSE